LKGFKKYIYPKYSSFEELFLDREVVSDKYLKVTDKWKIKQIKQGSLELECLSVHITIIFTKEYFQSK